MPVTPFLRTPPFRDFFLGRLVSLLGSSMAPVALAFAVLDASGRPADLGIVLACQIVPQLALVLVGGAVADRFPRRAVLVVANLGAGLTQGAVAVVFLSGQYNLALIAALELANGALEAFTSPALRGIVPELLAPHDLQRGNALLASTQNATKILGPTAAGLLVVALGGGWAIALDALSFVAAAGFLARLRPAPRDIAARPPMRLVRDIRDGWHEFRGLRWVWTVTLSFCVLNLVSVGSWQILGPTLTAQRSGQAAWGLALSVRAVGLLVMSALMYRLVLSRPLRTGRLAGALGALGLLALGLGADLPWLLVAVFVAGLGLTVSGITWDTALQRNIPHDVLSRVVSFDDLLSYAAIPIGQLLVGPAAARWGGQRVALCCGIVYAVASLAPLVARSVRTLPASDDKSAPQAAAT